MSIAPKAWVGRPGFRIPIGAGNFTVLQYGRIGFGGPHSGYRAAFLEEKGLACEATHFISIWRRGGELYRYLLSRRRQRLHFGL